ncbi:MAG: hypothetical protein N4A72_20180 [Bacteroidales bacterium]|nr:hypothetical protein [Bacteroidales bacterium]
MRYIIVLIFMCILGCKQNDNLLLGTWVGEYNESVVKLCFAKDSLSIIYANTGIVLKRGYQVDGKNLLLNNKNFGVDSCRINKPDRGNLVLRPKKRLQSDVDIMYLVDFKRVE